MPSRSDEYMRGFREASRLAVKFLHAEADDMNDPKAKQIFDSAAFRVGTHLKRVYRKRTFRDPMDFGR